MNQIDITAEQARLITEAHIMLASGDQEAMHSWWELLSEEDREFLSHWATEQAKQILESLRPLCNGFAEIAQRIIDWYHQPEVKSAFDAAIEQTKDAQ
jgi:hypothetical protein